MQALFENNRMTVFVPEIQIGIWTQTAQIKMEAEQAIGDGKTLRLLIEKDFACLEPRGADEDDADAFPHPLKRNLEQNSLRLESRQNAEPDEE